MELGRTSENLIYFSQNERFFNFFFRLKENLFYYICNTEKILHGVEREKILFYKFCSLLQVFTEKRVTTQMLDCTLN